NERLFGAPNTSTHPKDAINDRVVDGATDAVNPEGCGTKCAAHHVLEIPAGGSAQIRVRLASKARGKVDFDGVFATRRAEADAFYATVIPPVLPADEALVMRQAL